MWQNSTCVDLSKLHFGWKLLAKYWFWLPIGILDVQKVHLVLYSSHHFFIWPRRGHHIDSKLLGFDPEMAHLANVHLICLFSFEL